MFLGRTFVHGVHALCYLNRMEPGRLASASRVARSVGVPPEHARKILMALAEGGLVVSVRGRAGGYALARDPAAISILEVLECFNTNGNRTLSAERICQIAPDKRCQVRPRLKALHEQVRQVLADQTLASLIGNGCGESCQGSGTGGEEAWETVVQTAGGTG